MSTLNEDDHDLIIKHGVKLSQVCASISELKSDNKDLRKEMKGGFDKLLKKFDENTVGCSTNRATCTKDMDKKIAKKVDWKYFGGLITLLTFALVVLKYI